MRKKKPVTNNVNVSSPTELKCHFFTLRFRLQTIPMTSKLWKIGLTGGIASGKSHIAKDLAALGVTIIDADKLGHKAYEPGTESHASIVKSFGADIVDADNRINRQKLGAIVFRDASQMKKLTDIVWPAINQLAQSDMKQLEDQGSKVVVLEAAVLIEAGWHKLVDEVWVATVPREVAIERMQHRNKLSREDAERRIDAQLTNEQRQSHAHVVIDTNRPRDETQQISQRIFREREKQRLHHHNNKSAL